MTHSPSKILATYIKAQATFTDPADNAAWPLYIAFLPSEGDSPVNAACIYDTSGVKQGRLASGLNLFSHGMQIKVRAATYAAGWTKATAVADLLEALHRQSVTIEGIKYEIDSVSQTSPILYIGREASSKSSNFTINMLMIVREV